MSTTSGPVPPPPPPSAPPGPPGQGGPGGAESGPRVSRDEMRDLARLRRARGDRKVAGVAGGVARHLDVDPLLIRVAFVVLTLFGGGGILLYAVAWVLVPEEDTGAAVVQTEDGVRSVALVITGGVALLALVGDSFGGPDVPWPVLVVGLALLVIFGRRGAASAPPPQPFPTPEGAAPQAPAPVRTFAPYTPPRQRDPRRRGPLLFPFTLALAALGVGVVGMLDLAGADVPSAAYAATVLGVSGVMLLVGSVYGRAGGLILVGLLAAAATATAAAVDDTSIGTTTHVVRTADELRGSYDLGIGELVVDLTRITDPQDLDGLTVRLDQGIGHLLVIVPDDGLRVVVDSRVDVGESRLFGVDSDGETRAEAGEEDEPTLRIDARLNVGQIDVRTSTEGAGR